LAVFDSTKLVLLDPQIRNGSIILNYVIDRQPAVLIPGQAAHLFRDDAAHPFRLIVARHSD
jgi:hypothetical protein